MNLKKAGAVVVGEVGEPHQVLPAGSRQGVDEAKLYSGRSENLYSGYQPIERAGQVPHRVQDAQRKAVAAKAGNRDECHQSPVTEQKYRAKHHKAERIEKLNSHKREPIRYPDSLHYPTVP